MRSCSALKNCCASGSGALLVDPRYGSSTVTHELVASVCEPQTKRKSLDEHFTRTVGLSSRLIHTNLERCTLPWPLSPSSVVSPVKEHSNEQYNNARRCDYKEVKQYCGACRGCFTQEECRQCIRHVIASDKHAREPCCRRK